MRKLLIIAAFFFAALSSCKKNSGSASFMMAMINGASFSRNNCVATLDTLSVSFIQLNIWGAYYNQNSTPVLFDTPGIYIGINNFKGAGRYPIIDTVISLGSTMSVGEAGVDSNYTPPPSSTAVYGTIDITSTTPDIVGTFSFTSADSTKVSTGTFRAQIAMK